MADSINRCIELDPIYVPLGAKDQHLNRITQGGLNIGFTNKETRNSSESNQRRSQAGTRNDKDHSNIDQITTARDAKLKGHKAHLAVASLTITYDRERVIDFTTPFMSLSLSVIIQKSKQDTGLQFTAPLSREVWISVLIAYIVVSLMLFLLGRVTPHEWYARHPCSTRVENQFTLCNSFWFTVGSLMQQGCDISPRATSTRIIGTIWWFFILIMVSSYTANLAAFLTIDRMETEIENVEDLTRQTKIKYGTLYGGSTYSFFKRGVDCQEAKRRIRARSPNHLTSRAESLYHPENRRITVIRKANRELNKSDCPKKVKRHLAECFF
ncbi:hypothetical protein T265_00747 [Opisthorchis viverrini]|uniref:Ionotropic glutamate receptor C-terminal domain-containing protein n=1 Tax=Opisthorchis viverrini TaxID=6198 RepID=A0A075A570_OPIVI|nr:hypothetical protein T265_00747 [Opisthorchis viverrini]KER33442.1 hypothetical protein T265_00747 [Opisthorchis viverrini]